MLRGLEQLGTADLAVLSSLSQRQVVALVASGEIRSVRDSDPARVRPEEARRLAARGVEGFEEPARPAGG